jgi:hypothetical protein
MSITINGTTGIAGVDGSAATPSVQGADANTGVFFPAADTVALTTGGSERMRIDSSGNVGIGTTSPAYKLDVNGSVGASGSVTISTGGTYVAGSIYSDANWGMLFRAKQASPPQADFRWSNSADIERMRIGTAGQIGIGGANYGTSGQVLTSGGSGAAPSWATAGPGFASSVVTAKSRASGTVFQNTTTGWLFVAFAGANNGTNAFVGATASPGIKVNSSNATQTGGSFMVPPSWYYYITYSVLNFSSEGQA